jgi:hypothetical protein
MLVLAVSGHREMREQDLVSLRKTVDKVLADLHRRMPHTPLLLLTGLAAGADQLVAESALKAGCAVMGILPMPLPIYRTTMSPAQAKAMDMLLEQCALTLTLPNSGRTEQEMRESEAVRAACYDDLGKFLACRCQILLALYNGEAPDPNKLGGTAHVVNYVIYGVSSEMNDLSQIDVPQTGVVYQITAPRPGESSCEPGEIKKFIGKLNVEAGTRERQTLSDKNDVEFKNLLRSMEQFNAKAAKSPVNDSEQFLSDAHVPRRSTFLNRLDVLCHQADSVSGRSSQVRKRILVVIAALGFGGTLAYAICDEVFRDRVLLWLILPALLLAAVVVHRIAKHFHFDEMYIDSRALSEALRVQYFWEMACISEPAASHCLPYHNTQIDWVRCALRNVMLFQPPEASGVCSPEELDCVARCWIANQRKWFSDRSKAQHKIVEVRDKIVGWTLSVGLLYSVVVPLFLRFSLPWRWAMYVQQVGRADPWLGALHVPGVVLTIVAAAVRVWTEQSGFVEQSREYGRIGQYFHRQSTRLSAHPDDGVQIQQLLVETGIEALQENGRWLVLHRERPLEVVGA